MLIGISAATASAQTTANTTNLQKRIEERKTKFREALTDAQKTRLKNRCKAAQTKVANTQKIAEKHYADNDKKIESLLSKLNESISKQKESGADVTSLEKATADVSAKDQATKAAYSVYLSALVDTSDIDCHADPEGFKASLVDAREQFLLLKMARQELRKSLKNVLLPVLRELKTKKAV